MSDGEARRAAAIAGAVALVVAMAAGIAAIQYMVDQSYRGAAIRLVAAFILLIAVTRIRAFIRSRNSRNSFNRSLMLTPGQARSWSTPRRRRQSAATP